jgi:hypothetical protein
MLFIFAATPTIVSFIFPDIWQNWHYWAKHVITGWGLTSLLLFLGLLARYLHLRIYFKKNPSLIQAVEDERIRISWLKAYRLAFYLMIVIHGAYVLRLFESGLKHPFPLVEWTSLAVGLPALFGAALYFSREGGHE